MNSTLRVECLTKRWPHHTASGGYDRLAREIGAGVVDRVGVGGFWARQGKKIWKKRTRSMSYLENYEYGDYLAEWRIMLRARLRRPALVHVLYGDEQLDLLLRRRRLLPCPLVATFHLPTSRLRERFERKQKHLLGGMDAAVVVAKSQLADFGRWLSPEKVFYVPHGIDTVKFCPAEFSLEPPGARFVIVGMHMRDWRATHRIVDACHARKLPVEFDVVTDEPLWAHFTGCANTRCHAGISEERLRELYRNAHALLVPVLDATANNAALEALACGTPVISNAVGGIPDYVDDKCSWLFEKGEEAAIVQLIADICANPQLATSRREAARRKSLEFSWPSIVEQLAGVYRAVARPEGELQLAPARLK